MKRDLTELPWLRATSQKYCFVVAFDGNVIVGGAPIGMAIARKLNFDVKAFKQFCQDSDIETEILNVGER